MRVAPSCQMIPLSQSCKQEADISHPTGDALNAAARAEADRLASQQESVIAASSNGRTADFDSANAGSIPATASKPRKGTTSEPGNGAHYTYREIMDKTYLPKPTRHAQRYVKRAEYELLDAVNKRQQAEYKSLASWLERVTAAHGERLRAASISARCGWSLAAFESCVVVGHYLLGWW